MALDRQSIEKKDFPIARRGYEPEAVDAHLARISAEVEELQRALQSQSPAATPVPAAGDSLALAASEQVRAIVQAAEASAAEIQAAARDEAELIRATAHEEAQRTREDAVTTSQDHVGKVNDATGLMLQRVDAMENELGSLMESLRTGANRLNADLALLQGNMGELYEAAGQAGALAAPGVSAPAPSLRTEAAIASSAPDSIEDAYGHDEEIAPATEVSEPGPVADAGDVEGARLVALNMALNGQSRDETDRYLRENFDLADRDALLDEVYSSLEG